MKDKEELLKNIDRFILKQDIDEATMGMNFAFKRLAFLNTKFIKDKNIKIGNIEMIRVDISLSGKNKNSLIDQLEYIIGLRNFIWERRHD